MDKESERGSSVTITVGGLPGQGHVIESSNGLGMEEVATELSGSRSSRSSRTATGCYYNYTSISYVYIDGVDSQVDRNLVFNLIYIPTQ